VNVGGMEQLTHSASTLKSRPTCHHRSGHRPLTLLKLYSTVLVRGQMVVVPPESNMIALMCLNLGACYRYLDGRRCPEWVWGLVI
jgi:hypothetical protein